MREGARSLAARRGPLGWTPRYLLGALVVLATLLSPVGAVASTGPVAPSIAFGPEVHLVDCGSLDPEGCAFVFFPVGVESSAQVLASGNPAPTLKVSGSLPPGLEFTARNGQISGTPTTVQSASFTFTAESPLGSKSRRLRIVTDFDGPSFTSDSSLQVDPGTAFSFQVTATGRPEPKLKLLSGLPQGVSFNATTGQLSGTIKEGGNWLLQFQADNRVGATATQNFHLEVTGPQYLLSGASCPGVDTCVAVGHVQTTAVGKAPEDQTLIEHFDGSTWRRAVVANHGSLDGVSCPTSSFCMAAGDAYMLWDGVDWSWIGDAPSEAGGISCTSPSSCVAVGRSGWIQRWDGQAWLTERAPTAGQVLRGVDCVGPQDCTAVGNNSLGSSALSLHWDGSTWEPTQLGAGQLNGISCPAAGYCMATGYVFAQGKIATALAKSWDGSTWTTLAPPSPSPAPLGADGLLGVSCTSPTSCVAVGANVALGPDFSTARTLVERWDGSSWEVTPSPGSGVDGDTLLAVDCWGLGSCAAVGYHGGVMCNCVNGGVRANLRAPRAAAKISRAPNVLAIQQRSGTWLLGAKTVSLLPTPVLLAAAQLPPATRGQPYSFQLRAGGGTAPYAWSRSGTWPAGLSLSPTGLVTGTLSATAKAGTVRLVVKVTDASKKKQAVTATVSLVLR